MNINNRVKVVIVVAVSLSMASCSKTRLPHLKVNSPLNGQVFVAPEAVIIDAVMSDPDILFGQEILVTKENASADVVLDFKEHKKPDEHLVKSFLTEANTSYRIIVTAFGGEGQASDTLFVKAN